jgi:hypothetical protein
MDLNYSYSLVSFLVGLLSGFQFVAEKYRRLPFRAAWTRAGKAYLALRGLIASAVFLALYTSSLIEKRLLVWALVTGTGAEIILRTKFFIREKEKVSGGAEEVMVGPLNLLLFFQNLFLNYIEQQLFPEISQARARVEFLKDNLPETPFEEFCQRVSRNLDAFTPNSPNAIQIREDIQKLQQEYATRAQASTGQNIDDEFKHKLGYRLLHLVGEEGFKALVK